MFIFLIPLNIVITATTETATPLFLYKNQADLEKQKTKKKSRLPIHNYSVKNIPVQTIQEKIAPLFPHIPFTTIPNQQLLSFRSGIKDTTEIVNLLKQWDKPAIQIRFYIHIYEVATESLKKNKQLLSGLSNPLSIQYTVSTMPLLPLTPLISQLQQLEGNGEATLLAHPMIATTLLHPAEIRIGDKLPYTSTLSNGSILSSSIAHLDTGIHLKIKPLFVNNTHIYTTIEMEVETIKVWKQVGTTVLPILSKRFVQTELMLKDNNPFVIAGLTQKNQKKNQTHPPFLKSIPILRKLSKNKQEESSQTDLIIIIIPKIITPSTNTSI